MGAVNTSYTFSSSDTITSAKMNNIIDQTTFTDDAILGTTLEVATGKLKIRAQGITSNEMASNSVTANSIASNAVTTAKIANGQVTSAKFATNAILDSLPSNFPVKIISDDATGTQTIAGTTDSWVDTALSKTLTRVFPNAAGKIRIQAMISSTSNDSEHGVAFRIQRNGVTIGVGNASGDRLQATAAAGYAGGYAIPTTYIDYIDTSPGSSGTVQYIIQARMYSSRTGYINRSYQDPNTGDYVYRPISTLTLTELSP